MKLVSVAQSPDPSKSDQPAPIVADRSAVVRAIRFDLLRGDQPERQTADGDELRRPRGVGRNR